MQAGLTQRSINNSFVIHLQFYFDGTQMSSFSKHQQQIFFAIKMQDQKKWQFVQQGIDKKFININWMNLEKDTTEA